MNVRVLLVLAALLVAGVVAPEKPWKNGCTQVFPAQAGINLFAGTKDRYGYERVILNPNKGKDNAPRRTLDLKAWEIKYKHKKYSTGKNPDERRCSPWVGKNKKNFENKEQECPQAWYMGVDPWTQYNAVETLYMEDSDGASAYAGAHVQIKLRVHPYPDGEGPWRELPGIWIIPVSTYANVYPNRVKDEKGNPVTPDIEEEEADRYYNTWHNLRHDVTAIQCGAANENVEMPRPWWVIFAKGAIWDYWDPCQPWD